MKYEEAISELKEYAEASWGTLNEAFTLAIKALKKQIPKKTDDYYCPCCRYYFEDGTVKNYCPRCGQAME